MGTSTKLVASLTNAISVPSAEMLAPPDEPFAALSSRSSDTSAVLPSSVSRTTTLATPSVAGPPVSSSAFSVVNATSRPLADGDGSVPVTSSPEGVTDTSVVLGCVVPDTACVSDSESVAAFPARSVTDPATSASPTVPWPSSPLTVTV